MQITPFLWFDADIKVIIERYQEIFDDFEILETSPGPDGGYFIASVRIHGQSLTMMNGGPDHRLSEAFSLSVGVDTQDEIDRLWEALLDGGGKELACGWLTDRFGVTWQIVPSVLPRLMGSPDRAAAERARKAMMAMMKLDISRLQAAYDGG